MNIERPVGTPASERLWGSDYLADLIRQLDLKYLALNPGASLRGLHDSMVNYLGNEDPQMLLCLHEEHAIAIAHGYAKVMGTPMAVAVHSNVGLMHASMAIYNAWCDRVPMIIFGATGPVDAAQRRPWIDWLHTAKDQGALVRDFIKWDDQPASLRAAGESVLRAERIATTAPHGPVYICFDVALQEQECDPALPLPDPARYARPVAAYPDPDALAQVVDLIAHAKRPVILAGRLGKQPDAWAQRVRLAERLGATVISDLKQAAAFPTRHPLHLPMSVGPEATQALRDADLIIGLDWLDPAGTIKLVGEKGGAVTARYVHCSPEQYSHRGWSMDHQALPQAHLHFLCEPETLVDALLAADDAAPRFAQASRPAPPARSKTVYAAPTPASPLSIRALAHVLREATRDQPTSLIKVPLGWSNDIWEYDEPLDFLGKDGGAGIGSGPGMAIGAALALEGRGRLPVAVIGDGDFMFSASAFWTAARYRIPLLVVVANNSTYFNDEIHQERVAKRRGRPVENKAIAQALTDPDIDISAIARAQGAHAGAPVTNASELKAALADAITRVRAGALVVIDAHVLPGYES